MKLADFIELLLGPDLPIGFRAYDGSRTGPLDAASTLVVRSPDALYRIVTAPGELGLGRAYVAGDLDIEGPIWPVLELRHRLPDSRISPRRIADLAAIAGPALLRRPLPPPPEESRLSGRLHSRHRDAAAVRHHYDVSNAFYRMVLGPSMTYSCALWTDRTATLEAAQEAKYELIAQKLALRPGMRLLDIGCGWGGMLLHAAREHGVEGHGVTLSEPQAELARERIRAAGLADRITVEVRDYRDLAAGTFDAISSIGMFEHVGRAQQMAYFATVRGLLRPTGRFLNHAISRPPQSGSAGTRFQRRGFLDRYVFPDGELHEIGSTVSAIQQSGFEMRHTETLREHYALTLRAWVANLEANWDGCVAETSEGRARVWRLYMAAAALAFEDGRTQIHQVLAVPDDPAAHAAFERPPHATAFGPSRRDARPFEPGVIDLREHTPDRRP